MQDCRPRWKTFFILVFATLLARGLILTRYSLWEDEVTPLKLAGPNYSLGQVLEYILGVDRASFLWDFGLHFWTMCFGVSEVAARMPSLIFGALTTGFMYWLARCYVDEKRALAVGLLALFSPFLTYMSTEARPYMMMALIATFSLLCMVKIIQSSSGERKRWVLLHSATSVVGIYGNPFMYLFWGVQILCLLYICRREWRFLFWEALVLLFSIPHLIAVLGTYQQARFIAPISLESAQKLGGVLFRLPFGYLYATMTKEEIGAIFASPMHLAVLAVGLAGSLALLYMGMRVIPKTAMLRGRHLLFLLAGFLFLVWLVFPVRLSPRQCSLAVPIYFLLLGLGLTAPCRFWGNAIKAAVLAIMAVALAQQYTGACNPHTRTDYRGLIASVEREYQEGDGLYVFRSPVPTKMKLRYALPAEEYMGPLVLFEYYSKLPRPAIVRNPELLDMDKYRNSAVRIAYPLWEIPVDFMPALERMARQSGRMLRIEEHGPRLRLVVLEPASMPQR
jgi:Dolichyl-phosphate-mannose-protein mannosyltransferase